MRPYINHIPSADEVYIKVQIVSALGIRSTAMKKPQRSRRPKRIQLRSYSLLTSICISALLTLAGLSILSFITKEKPPSIVAQSLPSNLTDTILIPTPTRAIARGEKLRNVEYVETRWPRSRVSGSYITDISQYLNAVALTALPEHVPISSSQVTTEVVESNAVVEGIPEGMRAITVKVDIESAVEGWAQSGNYVDVIVLRTSPESASGLETKVIAENVKILSAGRAAIPAHLGETAPQTPATITLLTSQEDALKIKTAAALGKLTFALRAKGDISPTLSLAMNQKSLLGGTLPVVKKSFEFKGYARDAQGQLYVLDERGHWIRSKSLPEELNSSEHPAVLANLPNRIQESR